MRTLQPATGSILAALLLLPTLPGSPGAAGLPTVSLSINRPVPLNPALCGSNAFAGTLGVAFPPDWPAGASVHVVYQFFNDHSGAAGKVTAELQFRPAVPLRLTFFTSDLARPGWSSGTVELKAVKVWADTPAGVQQLSLPDPKTAPYACIRRAGNAPDEQPVLGAALPGAAIPKPPLPLKPPGGGAGGGAPGAGPVGPIIVIGLPPGFVPAPCHDFAVVVAGPGGEVAKKPRAIPGLPECAVDSGVPNDSPFGVVVLPDVDHCVTPGGPGAPQVDSFFDLFTDIEPPPNPTVSAVGALQIDISTHATSVVPGPNRTDCRVRPTPTTPVTTPPQGGVGGAIAAGIAAAAALLGASGGANKNPAGTATGNTPTPVPTNTPTPVPTNTPTPVPTNTPTPVPTNTPTPVPTNTPTPVPTNTPTPVPTNTPTPVPTNTPTPVPTNTPTPVPTNTPTPVPTNTPTPVPSSSPTISSLRRALPSATPSPRPSSTPTPAAVPPKRG